MLVDSRGNTIKERHHICTGYPECKPTPPFCRRGLRRRVLDCRIFHPHLDGARHAARRWGSCFRTSTRPWKTMLSCCAYNPRTEDYHHQGVYVCSPHKWAFVLATLLTLSACHTHAHVGPQLAKAGSKVDGPADVDGIIPIAELPSLDIKHTHNRALFCNINLFLLYELPEFHGGFFWTHFGSGREGLEAPLVLPAPLAAGPQYVISVGYNKLRLGSKHACNP